jgi:serine/threonine-protein kinase
VSRTKTRTLDPAAVAKPADCYLDDLRILQTLARGGTARVFLAETPSGERVAVKLLDPTYAADPVVTASFLAEAEVARAVCHPGLVDVRAAACTAETGIPYLVMELLDGETLQAVVDRVDLPLGAIVAIAEQVATAVAALHDAGYVHCDVKAANVFVLFDTLAGQPRVKVIDFGVARRVDAEATGDVISGTPTCMAPEQWRGEATPKSDVYALGCMLYELVTGEPLFSGTLPQLAVAHCEALPPRPSNHRSGIDPKLERLIVRTLAKDPAFRPTMIDVARELARIVPVVELDAALAELCARDTVVEASA